MSYEINVKTIDTEAIKKKAGELYSSGSFGCGESVLRAFVEELHIDIPEEVIALSSAFSGGIGGAGCTCGAVAGGVMVIGMIFGRHQAFDPQGTVAKNLGKELHDAFRADHRAICCRILSKDLVFNSPERKKQCISFVEDVSDKVCTIIKREKKL